MEEVTRTHPTWFEQFKRNAVGGRRGAAFLSASFDCHPQIFFTTGLDPMLRVGWGLDPMLRV